MEQFNLEKYLENPNQKIVTRDGRSVRIICTNRKSENCPIVTLIQDSTDDSEYVYYYTIDGKGVIRGNESMDLFFATEKQECPFKKGDRVLVRDYDNESWRPRIFSSYDSYDKECKYKYECEGDDDKYIQCIPYNEHTWKLLGTTDEYKEENMNDYIYFHIPGISDLFELNYMLLSRMYHHPDHFRDNVRIGSIYGAGISSISALSTSKLLTSVLV